MALLHHKTQHMKNIPYEAPSSITPFHPAHKMKVEPQSVRCYGCSKTTA